MSKPALSLLLPALAGTFMAVACAPVDDLDGEEVDFAGEIHQQAICTTCGDPPPDDPPDPEDPPPPPPPPPAPCTQSYFTASSAFPWDTTPSGEHRNAGRYASRQQYPMGFPNYHGADYGYGVVLGTFLVKNAGYAGIK